MLNGFIVLLVSSMLGTAVTGYFLHQKMQEDPGKWTWRSIWWEVTFSNIFALKDRVEPTIKYIPDIWAYLIKGLIPQLLIILFVNSAATDDGNGQSKFFHYGGYGAMPFQVMGVVIVAFTAVLFLVGFFVPQIYASLATSYEGENQEKTVDHAPGEVVAEKAVDVEELPEQPVDQAVDETAPEPATDDGIEVSA